jgi:hypothetical protein
MKEKPIIRCCVESRSWVDVLRLVYIYIYIYICTYICMYVCICIYVCMYICVYVYMYVYVYVRMYMYIYVCMHMYIYVCICMCMYMYVYVCICIYICMYMCIYVCVCTYVCRIVRNYVRGEYAFKLIYSHYWATNGPWMRLFIIVNYSEFCPSPRIHGTSSNVRPINLSRQTMHAHSYIITILGLQVGGDRLENSVSKVPKSKCANYIVHPPH